MPHQGKKTGDVRPTGGDSLESIPNVGPVIADKLRRLGFDRPSQLAGQDPYLMYRRLCDLTGRRQDPCLLDVFIAAVAYSEGQPARPWWSYTAERKARLGNPPDG